MSTEVPIVITGDNIVEDDEDFTVSLGMVSVPAGFVNTDAITTHATSISSKVTIDDDDTLSVNFVSCDSQNEGTNAELIVSFSPTLMTTGYSFSFFNDAGETTAEGSDFDPLGDLASGSADIPTGASLLTFSLTYLQDMKVEDDEEIVYVLNSVDGPVGDMVVGTTATITCIITDDDDAITLVDGTTDSGDYTAFSTSFEIPTCTSTFEYLLGITDDQVVENCESLTISLLSVDGPTDFRSDALSIDMTLDESIVTISEDETATVGIKDILTYTEGAGASLTIVLSSTVPLGGFQDSGYSATITILQGTTEGTVAGGDYSSDMETVELSTSSDDTTITIGLIDNLKFEDLESYTVSLIGVSPPPGFKTEIIEIDTTEDMKTGVIVDDDSDLDYSGDLASTGSFIDYSPELTVDIPADTTKVSFTVTVSGDSWVEDTETTDISLSSLMFPTGYSRTDGTGFTTPSTFSLTVTDDNSALDWIEDTASTPSDYTEGDPSVSIPTLATTQTFEFVVHSNKIVEDDESLTVSFNSIIPPSLIRMDTAVYISTPPGDSSIITIVDDDTGVNLEGGSSKSYSNVDGTALVPLNSNPQMFSSSLSLSLVDDNRVEDFETFSVFLDTVTEPAGYNRNPGEAVVIGTGTCSQVVTTIQDDDTATILMDLNESEVTEGNTELVIIDIEGGQLCVDGVSVSTTTVMALPQLMSQVFIVLPTAEDELVEDNESFDVVLVDVNADASVMRSNVVVITDVTEDRTTTVTIMDDDSGLVYGDITTEPGLDYSTTDTDGDIPTLTTTFTYSITLSDDSLVEGDESFSLSLTAVNHPSDISYDAKTAFDETSTIVDYTASPGMLRLPQDPTDKLTATVTVDDDNLVEDLESFCLSMSSVTGPLTDHVTIATGQESTTVCITDDDTGVALTPLTAEEDDDYSTVTTSFEIDALSLSTTITIDITTDNILEDNESFQISVVSTTNPIGYDRGRGLGVVLHSMSTTTTATINDDDTASCFFSPSTYCPSESDSTSSVTFTCDIEIEDTGYSATLTYINADATVGSDFSVLIGSVGLLTGGSDVSFAVSILSDIIVEDDESFFIAVSNIDEPTGFIRSGIITADSSATVTIKDDDTALAYTPKSALYANDYTSTVTMTTYPSATTTFYIDLDIVNDMIVEDDQSFCIEFTGGNEPSGFSRSDAIEVMTSTTTVTIKDDDSALAYSPKSAVYENDYTSTVTMTTYPSATTTFYIDLDIVNDMIVEDDQSFCIEFTSGNEPSGFSRSDAIEIMTSTSTVTIKDDDSATCSLSLVSDCVTEDTDVSICILCDKMFEDDGFEVALAYTPKSAVYDNDYTSTVTMTTYPSSTTTFYINLDIVDDMIVEDDQSFCIELAGGNEPSGFSRSDAIEVMTSTSTVTIKDDDTALGYAPKSAVHENDYTSTVTMTTYPSATTTFYIDLDIVDDMIVEDDQSFCIEFTGGNEPSGFSRSDAIEVMTSTSTVTIKDDDSALAYSPKSAVYGSDYTSTVTMTTYPSATTTFYIDLDIVDDMIVEDDQSFCIELAGGNEPSGFSRSDAIEVMTSTSTVTIKDDDSATCSLSLVSDCVTEDTDVSICILCDKMFEDDGFEVALAYTPKTAVHGDDYTSTVTMTTYPSSTTTFYIDLDIVDDMIVEDDQSFCIELAGGNEPTRFSRSDAIEIMTSTSTVTIKDDDTATCSLSLVSDCVTEDTDVSICIFCDKMFEDDGFEISLGYTPKSAVYDNDYTSTVTMTTYPSATTTFYIDLDIVDDMIVEDDQSFCIEFTGGNEPSGFSRSDAIEVMTSTSTVTIKDDDSATCSLSLVSDCVSEDTDVSICILCDKMFEDDGFQISTCSLSLVSECVTEDTDVSICILCDKMFEDDGFEVALAYTPKSAVYDNDYTSTVTMTTYPSATTTFYIDLDIVDDMIVEDDQSFCIELAGGNEPSGFSRSDAIEVMTSTSTVTIKDDDSATCSLSLVNDCVTEDTDVTICILCDKMFEEDGFEVALSYSPKSAVYDNDYTSTVTMTTYPSATTTFYIGLDIVDDMIVEDDQSFCIELADGNEPSGFSRSDAIEVMTSTSTVTIKDDDSALAYTPKSAVYDSDYTSTVTMTTYPSATTTFYIDLDIVDDMIVEDDQSFCIELAGGNEPSGFSRSDAIEVMTSTSTVTIKDDDTALAYSQDSAVFGNDYTSTVTMTTYPSSTTTFYIDLDIVDDMIVEDDQSFCIEFTGGNEPSGFLRSDAIEVMTSTSTVTIKDDDSATCSLSIVSECVTEDTDVSICILCDKMFEDDGFELSLAYTPKSAVYDNDYTSTVTMTTYPSATTMFYIDLDIVDDMIVEDDQTFCVGLAGGNEPSGFSRTDAIEVMTSTSTVTIKDDDSATCSLSIVSECVTEDTDVSICILCDKMFEDDGFEVALAYTPKSAVYSNDYTSTVTVTTYPSSTTTFYVDLDIVDDMIVEDDQSFCIELAGGNEPSGFSRSDAIEVMTSTSTVTIKDDDSALAYTPKSADYGNDYTSTVTMTTYPSSTTTFYIDLTVVNDMIVEDDQSFCIELAGGNEPSGFSRSDAIEIMTSTSTVTIKDDDTALAYLPKSAVYGNDYTSTVTMTTYPSATTSFYIDLDIVDDTIVEDDQSFCIEFADGNEPSGFSRSDAIEVMTSTSTVTIKDDDTAFTYIDGDATEGNDFTVLTSSVGLLTTGSALSFAVSILPDIIVEDDQSFTIAVSNVDEPTGFIRSALAYTPKSALYNNDYTSTVTMTTYPSATTTFYINLDIVDDMIVEDDQSFCIELAGGNEPSGFSRSDAIDVMTSTSTVTIKDDDTALEYSSKSAVYANDYTSTVTMTTYPSSTTTFYLDLGIVDDMIVEDDQSFCIELAGGNEPSGFSRSDAIEVMTSTSTVTIKDDDTALAYSPKSAVYSNDYTSTVTMTTYPSATTSFYIDLDIVNDMIVEDDQSFCIELAGGNEPRRQTRSALAYSPKSALYNNDYTSTVTMTTYPSATTTFYIDLDIVDDMIVEDDQSFCIELAGGNEPSGFLRSDAIEVMTSTSTVTIKDDDSALAYSPKSAVYDNDYTSTVTMTTYPSSTTTFYINLDIVDDMIVEEDQSFCIELAGGNEPSGFSRSDAIEIMTSTSTVTIKDDDTALVYSPKSAIYDNDYTSTVTMTTYPSATTTFYIDLDIVDDMIVEDDQSFCIELAGGNEPSGFSRSDAIEVMTSTSTVTIKDDDSATCSLSLVSECVTEDTEVSICILCDKMFEDDGFEVSLEYTPKSAVYGNDYTSTVTMTTYPSATTTFYIDLDIVDDMIVEDDQSFCIELAGGNEPSGFSRSDAIEVMTSTSTVTIKDDDTALVYSPKSALYGNDYTSTVTMTTYPSATTSFYIDLDIVDDMIVEDDQSFCIELADGNEPTGFSRSDAIKVMTSTSTVTVKDDDSALTYNDGDATEGSDFSILTTSVGLLQSGSALSFAVEILSDMTVEDDQSFMIAVSNVDEPTGFIRSGIITADSSATVTIKDDDTGKNGIQH
ncbi:hypothetical protein HOLleu_37599 [Holothuria leucospilota]|uniref:Calx-beta domain-containing protein n=1 Tax=Holothuria leucospilota TaxID=206669 RepID=A0A9Q1BEV8_HOLLE|nr:hypothetical protein HOLleu_37599 [Holothuria leucospilota]